MKFRREIEARFFDDGPAFCLKGAVCLIGAGLSLSILGYFVKPETGILGHLSFAGLLAIPACILALLSLTIARRHILTIPLVLAFCVFAGRYLLIPPGQVFDGVNTSWLHYAVGWIVFFGMIIGILGAIELMYRLWRKGAFRQQK